MSTKITLTYFGFHGEGATVKEAKLDAGRKIEALHEGYWTPAIVEWRGHAAIVYRTLDGWHYGFIGHPGEAIHSISGGSSGYGDYRETLRAAQRHVADIGWQLDEPLDLFPDWLTDDRDRREIRDRRVWASKVSHLMKQGISSNDAAYIVGGMQPVPEGITTLAIS